jgi:hypothetical protein
VGTVAAFVEGAILAPDHEAVAPASAAAPGESSTPGSLFRS